MKTKNTIFLLVAIILIILGLICNTSTTKYATIKGESFIIPKIEGDYYYEKDTNSIH